MQVSQEKRGRHCGRFLKQEEGNVPTQFPRWQSNANYGMSLLPRVAWTTVSFKIPQSLPFQTPHNCGLVWAKLNMSIVRRRRGKRDTINSRERFFFFPAAYGKDNKLSPITCDGSTHPMWLRTCARGSDTQVCGFQLFRGEKIEKKGKCWRLLIYPRVVYSHHFSVLFLRRRGTRYGATASTRLREAT